MVDRTSEHWAGVVRELCALPAETEYVEFKVDNADPQVIGEYISALANGATLANQPTGYLVWGIDNETHQVVGTTFAPLRATKGAEDLFPWLVRLTTPQLHFAFHEVLIDGKHIVLLEIPAATDRPVQFRAMEYVRVGSHKKLLRDHPELERALWGAFRQTSFELSAAATRVSTNDVFELLDVPGYFELLGYAATSDSEEALQRMERDRLVSRDLAGGWTVLALGAILFARNLDAFPSLRRKAIRVITYEGPDKFKAERERTGRKGYAIGFANLISHLEGILPRNEVIRDALRREVPMYPTLSLREIIANALIHQDFTIRGAGPMVEVFSDRLEVTNPGEPLMDTNRFLDTAPRSRNEELASLMRRSGICEERGSGVDRVITETELFQLPPPIFEAGPDATRVVMFSHQEFKAMGRADRIRACYQHACLRHVQRQQLTNASLRQRFGIHERNSAMASRIIGETLEAGLIRKVDLDQGKKYAGYVPFWA